MRGHRVPSEAGQRTVDVGVPAREDLRRRLFRLGMIVAAGAVAYASVDILTASWSGPPSAEDPVLMALLAAVSTGIALVARSPRISQSTSMDLAFAYQVVACTIISLAEVINTRQPDDSVWGVSWVCVAMIAFPAALPYRRLPMILAAVLTALSGPLMYLVAGSIRGKPLHGSEALNMYVPNFITLGVAVLIILYITYRADQLEHARRMGAYRLVRRIGGGGMGEVWQAEHELLARPAAIKLIQVSGTSHGSKIAALESRFFREAQVTAGLRSPHTITVFDYGITKDGRQYYVMELLDGITLQEAVTRFGPMGSGRVTFLLLQICESLAEAHHADLIHRDVKPANVILCQKGGSYDFVKVLDFGLVRVDHDADTHLTLGSEVLGSPGYTAPESLRSGRYDQRSDIYGLGCLAYFLLTGQLLFEAEGAVDRTLKHVSEDPTPVDERAPEPMHEELAALVMQCVSRETEDRPGSCAEIIEELEGIATGCPWSRHDAREWWLDHMPVATGTSTADTRILTRE